MPSTLSSELEVTDDQSHQAPPRRSSEQLPRPKGELEALEAAWELPKGWRIISAVNNTVVGYFYIGAAFLFFLLAGILALLMRLQLAVPSNTFLSAGDLQPGLHHARHRDDVPVRRAGRRGDGRPAAAADARRARPALPATRRFRLLGLSRRRPGLLRHAVLRPCAVRRLVHVPAADRHALLAGHRRRFLAARHRLHRDLRHRRCDRAHRRRAAHARARHDARPACRCSPGPCWSSPG